MFDENMEFDRLITSTKTMHDEDVENKLRPKYMSDYVGQDKVKSLLNVYMTAARNRNEPLDHVLLYGPPGLGKTTLAHIIASEMRAQIRVTSGPAIEKTGDLAAILSNIGENGILFIDEIHRLNKTIEEILYPAMEDFSLDIILGQGPSARTVKIPLPKFTLIGATTKSGSLSAPLRDRFGVLCRLEMYSPEELKNIVIRSASILNISIDDAGAYEIARRSRGTPRIANRLMKRVRDFAEVNGSNTIDYQIAKNTLDVMEIDEIGLDHIDRRLLETMIDKFNGGPVGLETLSAALSEDANTIEDVYEPYLMQLGYIMRTGRGRIVLEAGYKHMGRQAPSTNK